MTTGIACRETGEGRPLLLLHGAGEDAEMLDDQAAAFAREGFRVLWYDRRGTGGSTREGWPEGGVARHVADAATLLTERRMAPATVLGLSSGGIIALELAVRHPELVTRAVAWEPAALLELPDGADLHGALTAPVEEHLAAHPGDWRGAHLVLLSILFGEDVDPEDPDVARQLRNAEAAVRDDTRVITRHTFEPGSLRGARATVAVGREPDALLGQIADRLAADIGTPKVVVDRAGHHEVYLEDPRVLAEELSRLASD